jgi:type IV secretory pathway TraG/TraD family ATPase VirD4
MSPIPDHLNQSVVEIERPLMTPDEVMRLRAPQKAGTGAKEKIVSPGDMLIFMSGHCPIYGKQMLYFFDPILRSRAEIPPPGQFYSIRNGSVTPQGPFGASAFRRPHPFAGQAPLPPNQVRDGDADADSPVEPLSPERQQLQPARGFVERLQIDTER